MTSRDLARDSAVDERCPLFDLVATLDGPRERKELASIVVKWITGWGPEGWDAGVENVPRHLFRDDEIEVAASLTSFELAIAAALMFGEAADFIERRDGTSAKADKLRITASFLARGIAPSLRASRIGVTPHGRPERRAPRSRRVRSTQRARSPGRPSGDDPPEHDRLAPRGRR